MFTYDYTNNMSLYILRGEKKLSIEKYKEVK